MKNFNIKNFNIKKFYTISLLQILLYIAIIPFANAKTWSLDDVIITALKQSYPSQIIKSQKNSDEWMKTQALAEYDLMAIFKGQYPQDVQNISPNKMFGDYSYILQKKWFTGSQIRTVYCYSYGISHCGSPFTGSFTPPSLTSPSSFYFNKFSFQMEQSLLRNFFGREDRLKIKEVHSRYKSIVLSRKEDTKKLILSAAQNFWNAYTAYTSWRQAQLQTKYYKKLVILAKRKKSLGHIMPGELPQIQSQYERALKFQNTTHTQWKNSSLLLQSFLQIESSKIQFKKPKHLLMPSFKEYDSNSFNAVQVARHHYDSVTANIQSKKYYYLPYLKFKAQADYSGQDPRSMKQAFEQAKIGNQKFYTLGLELVYPIPTTISGLRTFRSLKYKQKEYDLELLQTKEKIKNQLQILWNTVKNSQSAMKTAIHVTQLQNQALREIQKSYEQGRLSINDLISAQDRKIQVELEKIKSQKDYDLAVIQYLSLTDQLIQRYRS